MVAISHALEWPDAVVNAPETNKFRHALKAVHVVVSSQLPAVRQLLIAHLAPIRRMLAALLAAEGIEYEELKHACSIVVTLEGVDKLLEAMRQRRSLEVIHAACDAISETELEADELWPCAAPLASMALEWLEEHEIAKRSGRSPPMGELNALAGVLGKAVAHIDPTQGETAPIIERSLLALLKLLEYGIDCSRSSRQYFRLVYYALWSLRESAADSQAARAWLRQKDSLPELLGRVLNTLVDSSSGPAPADQEDSDALASLQEGLSLLALSCGAGHAVEAMRQWPKRRALQAAGCVALRTVAQLGELRQPCPDAIAVLMQAKRDHDGDADIETPADHALGWLGCPNADVGS